MFCDFSGEDFVLFYSSINLPPSRLDWLTEPGCSGESCIWRLPKDRPCPRFLEKKEIFFAYFISNMFNRKVLTQAQLFGPSVQPLFLRRSKVAVCYTCNCRPVCPPPPPALHHTQATDCVRAYMCVRMNLEFLLTGAQHFSKYLEANSKFKVPELLQEASSVLRTHKYWALPYKI